MLTFERNYTDKTAKSIAKMINGNRTEMTFDNCVQRNYVWKIEQQSMLIDSILRGYPVPDIYANRTEAHTEKGTKYYVYDVLDGQQRLTTIARFVAGKFALKGLPEFEDEEGNSVDLNDCYYDDLDENYKEVLNNFTFRIQYYDNMDDESVAEIFRRLNNGKSLTNIEKIRVYAKSFDTIRELANHPIFNIGEMMTEASRRGYHNEDMVIKLFMILHDDTNLDAKHVKEVLANAEFTEQDVTQIKTILDYARKIHDTILADDTDLKLNKKIAKRMYGKVHFVSLIPLFMETIENGMPDSSVVEFLQVFYGSKTASISTRYNGCSHSGSNHKSSVDTRIAEVKKAWEEFEPMKVKEDSEVGTESVEDVEQEEISDSIVDDLLADLANE